jgi:hypothetical protein
LIPAIDTSFLSKKIELKIAVSRSEHRKKMPESSRFRQFVCARGKTALN